MFCAFRPNEIASCVTTKIWDFTWFLVTKTKWHFLGHLPLSALSLWEASAMGCRPIPKSTLKWIQSFRTNIRPSYRWRRFMTLTEIFISNLHVEYFAYLTAVSNGIFSREGLHALFVVHAQLPAELLNWIIPLRTQFKYVIAIYSHVPSYPVCRFVPVSLTPAIIPSDPTIMSRVAPWEGHVGTNSGFSKLAQLIS